MNHPMLYRGTRLYTSKKKPQMMWMNTEGKTGVLYSGKSFEKRRDELAMLFDGAWVIIESTDGDRCWAQCHGAYASSPWECMCPCGGFTHGGENRLVDHTLVNQRRVPIPRTGRLQPDGTYGKVSKFEKWIIRSVYWFKHAEELQAVPA